MTYSSPKNDGTKTWQDYHELDAVDGLELVRGVLQQPPGVCTETEPGGESGD